MAREDGTAQGCNAEREETTFRLTISSIEEFAFFVAIIRSEAFDELDEYKLAELTKKLGKQTGKLDAAVQQNQPPTS